MKYILEGHTPVKVDDIITWARWFETADRQVKLTKINTVALALKKDIEVSTVFLGMDHGFGSGGPPILFETMVFGGKSDQYMNRYATWDQAEAGHEATVQHVKEKESES